MGIRPQPDRRGTVQAVNRDAAHAFSKPQVPVIRLLAGLGVEDDVHNGVTVKHRSRVAADPTQPNLRQVHLMHAELFDELATRGFAVSAGQLGENITTSGLELLGLPTGTRLQIGEMAIVEVTGLRNPCSQIEAFGLQQRPGLLAAVLGKDEDGSLIRKAGIMGIVIAGGEVRAGDVIAAMLPPEPWKGLERV
ncbi:MOSC domain-containing protein [Deinococcus sp.]|uniref:MOSC domain-containing protein n=1 Tax=Deinococcus sp. TaxID=47478 RepID=UPI003B5A22C4